MKKISYRWNILIFILLRSKRPCQAQQTQQSWA
jgi:hypothetical protein